MNLILNRDFKMPEDGWYQLAPLGEFPHMVAGVVQVVDSEACTAMTARFNADAAVANFAGLLVDFDHFSLDDRSRSEAAGWIMGMEARATGLWANIRWSDVGEEAVKGGRYRFLSPVWARNDCVDLGNGRVRPVRLLNAAVTNEPNLKGLMALSNSSQKSESRIQNGEPVDRCASIGKVDSGRKETIDMKRVIEKLTNHLGLPGDATEDVVLEKMQGLPGLTAVTELQNSLSVLQTKHDSLVASLKTVEGELVNRHMADFEGVISEGAKPFWTEQLIQNRTGALAALGDLREMAGKAVTTTDSSKDVPKDGGRKPLHNRVTARPAPPGQGDQTGAAGDSKAVRIRNRAHEISKAEKIPFGVAFRRAEREVLGIGQ
jgi:phage I-like protein